MKRKTGILLFFLILLCLSAGAVWGETKVSYGIEGNVKQCGAFPVDIYMSQWPAGSYEVLLENVSGQPFLGNLELSVSSLFLSGSSPQERRQAYTCRREIVVGDSGEAQVSFVMGLDLYGGRFRCRILDAQGETVYTSFHTVESPEENEIYTALLSAEDSWEEELGQLHLESGAGQITMSLRLFRWTAADVPGERTALDQIQVLVAQEGQLEALKEKQRENLLRWRQEGGILIEVSGQELSEKVLEALNGEALDRLLGRNRSGYMGLERSIILEETPIRKQPPVKLYLSVLLIYIAVAGPGLYLILRHRRKRYYLFGSIIAASLAAAGLIAGLGYRHRIRAPFLVYEARYIQKGDSTRLDTTCGIRAPYNSSYALYVEPEYELLPFRGDNSAYWDGSEEPEEMAHAEAFFQEEVCRLEISGLPAFQPFYFTLNKQLSGGAMVRIEASYYEEKLQGFVTNCSPYVISDAQLFLGSEGVAFLGDLKPGQTVSLEAAEVRLCTLEAWIKQLSYFLEGQERDWKRYLELEYQQVVYDWNRNEDQKGALLTGLVEDGGLDFQMDSGYEIYGKSVLQAEAILELSKGELSYDPWFGNRGMDGDEDYALELGSYISQKEKEAVYQVEGRLERLRFLPREMVETEYEEQFKGDISLYNWESGKYDLLEEWSSRILSGEELRPYVEEGTGRLQVRYGAEERLHRNKYGEEKAQLLPAVLAVEREVSDAEG